MMDLKTVGREFHEFLFKSNLFAIAMGVVIGNAVGKVVNSIVADLVMPFVGVLQPDGQWRSVKLSFWRFNFTIGNFVSEVINFLIIATIVFLITKAFVSKQAPAPVKQCGQCLESIHPDAKRCKFCASEA